MSIAVTESTGKSKFAKFRLLSHVQALLASIFVDLLYSMLYNKLYKIFIINRKSVHQKIRQVVGLQPVHKNRKPTRDSEQIKMLCSLLSNKCTTNRSSGVSALGWSILERWTLISFEHGLICAGTVRYGVPALILEMVLRADSSRCRIGGTLGNCEV